MRSNGGICNWLRRFPDWERSLDNTPLKDRRPWLTYGAIEFLNSALRTDMRVYEYGVGGSTLFFLDRVSQVFSAEHDVAWANQLKTVISNGKPDSWRVDVVSPTPARLNIKQDPANPEAYASGFLDFGGMCFREYASTIDSYSDQFFDIVLVDGRARPSCVKHAIPKIKRSGLLVLDDAERERYHVIHNRLRDLKWSRWEFFGPIPYQVSFQSTCIWQRKVVG